MSKKSRTHYMVDCFIPDRTQVDGYRLETFSVGALSDGHAISEARFCAQAQYQPHHFYVRAVSRQGNKIIYKSEGD